MSSLPLQNYSIPSKPFWLPNVDPLVISSIVLSGSLAIDGAAGQTIDAACFASTSLLSVNVPNSNGYLAGISVGSVSSIVGMNELTIGANSGSNNAFISHNNAGVTTSAIAFTSSIVGGGLALQSQDATTFYIQNGLTALTSGTNTGTLTTQIANASNAYIIHKPDGANNASQIHFNSATSSIALVSYTGQAMGVGTYGVSFNPGTGSPVQLTTGYLDVNNSAMSNVSSINTTALPTATYGYPIVPGSNPFVFASNAASLPIVTFSNLSPGSIYRCGFSGSFQCVTNVAPTGYWLIGGFGSGGPPNDAESIDAVAADSVVQFNNSPGTLGAANAFYGCMFRPTTSTWSITVSAGPSLNTDISMFMGGVYLEKLL